MTAERLQWVKEFVEVAKHVPSIDGPHTAFWMDELLAHIQALEEALRAMTLAADMAIDEHSLAISQYTHATSLARAALSPAPATKGQP